MCHEEQVSSGEATPPWAGRWDGEHVPSPEGGDRLGRGQDRSCSSWLPLQTAGPVSIPLQHLGIKIFFKIITKAKQVKALFFAHGPEEEGATCPISSVTES